MWAQFNIRCSNQNSFPLVGQSKLVSRDQVIKSCLPGAFAPRFAEKLRFSVAATYFLRLRRRSSPMNFLMISYKRFIITWIPLPKAYARKPIILRPFHQTRPHGILMNVVHFLHHCFLASDSKGVWMMLPDGMLVLSPTFLHSKFVQ